MFFVSDIGKTLGWVGEGHTEACIFSTFQPIGESEMLLCADGP